MAMVRRLVDLSFGADELFSQALSLALPRVYEAAGWDLVTGDRRWRRAGGRPAVPELGQLHTEVIERDRRGGLRPENPGPAARPGRRPVRFAAGRGGGPVPARRSSRRLGELLRRNVVLAVHDIGAAEDRTFVTGALLSGSPSTCASGRATGPAEPLLRRRLPAGCAAPLAPARRRDRGGACRAARPRAGRPATHAAEWFAALLAEFGAHGEGIVLAEQRPALLVPDVARIRAVRIVHRMPPAGGGQAWHRPLGATGGARSWPPASRPGRATPGGRIAASAPRRRCRAGRRRRTADVPPPVSGRRSVACGRQCREARACHLAELREAELLATVTGPRLAAGMDRDVPAGLPHRQSAARPFPRRCAAGGRASAPGRANACWPRSSTAGSVSAPSALRVSYDPSRFAQVVASAAAIRLDRATPAPGPARVGLAGGVPPAIRPGPAWVIPQLRWLHEIERLCPLGGAGLAPADHAPPLDFDLTALPDWPGIRAGQRIRALRRHPLSMELAANRQLAWIALAGEDGPGPLAADLGAGHARRRPRPGAAPHGGAHGGVRRRRRRAGLARGGAVLAAPVCHVFRRSVPAGRCC